MATVLSAHQGLANLGMRPLLEASLSVYPVWSQTSRQLQHRVIRDVQRINVQVV